MSRAELAGVAELAELLGVSKQRVSQLRGRPGFPEPLAELAAGPIYDRRAVERWAIAAGRTVAGRNPRVIV